MKTYKYLFTLAMAGLLAVSCQEDTAINTNVRPAEVGETIMFGASAAYENANPKQTRTEYSGDVTDGKEKIWWVPGTDMVQIYCAEANVSGFTGDAAHTSHYTVMGSKGDGADHGNWLQKQSEVSLAWGSQDEHTFYGMYPSNLMFVNTDGTPAIGGEYVEGITMSGTSMSGYIHTIQTPITTKKKEGTTEYVATPDMRYAYMIAKTTTTREAAYTVDPETNKVNGVSLNFIPLATALEITLSLPTAEDAKVDVNPVPIAQISIQGECVAGQFTTNLEDWKGETVSELEVQSGAYSNLITIPVNASTAEGETGMGLLLQPGESLTFTVFLHPKANINALKIGFSSDKQGNNTVYKSISNAGIVALKKNVGIDLRLPVKFEHKELDLSAWMGQIEDKNIPISRLSLPGTGNSFSYGTTITTNKQYYQSQTLTFQQQWNAGIRAFEIVTDRYNSNTLNSSNTLANLILQCGKQDIQDKEIGESNDAKITVTEAVDAILKQLEAHPSETALAVFTYQPEGNSPNRRGYAYMYAFMNFINQTKYNGKLVLFTPSITLEQAKGKLMIVVRPNSKDEGDYYLNGNSYSKSDDGQNANIWSAITKQISGNNSNYIIAVDGCGTGKDKWGSRGFKITVGNDTKPARDISNWNGSMSNPSNQWWIEQYMYSGLNANNIYDGGEVETVLNDDRQEATIIRPPLNPTNPTEVLNFGYQTNRDYKCWYQEWSRVLSGDITQESGKWSDPTSTSSRYDYEGIKWFESYNEKLSNAKTTFDMATSGLYDGTHTDEGYPAYVFINSLCGYLAKDNDPEESVIPSVYQAYGGGYGDIVALAEKINKDFYDYVNSRINSLQSSTGIIFMDRVSNQPLKADGKTLDPSYWLPQLILGNNKAYYKDDIIVPAPEGSGDNIGGGGNTDGDDDDNDGGDADWGE